MTARYSFVGTVVLTCALVTAAFAGWSPDGATIKNTTNHIPKVAAANDGAYGSFVVWQEESAPNVGILRAQHVLPSGDVDPAWPADGFVLCNVATARGALGMVADGLGGSYVWWKEGAAIYLNRILATGQVASGWPARGRSIGGTSPATAYPSVIPDGANGIYLAWSSPAASVDPMSVQAIHLGPSNTGAGGWPNSIRGVAGGDPVATYDYWPSLALAPDGGVFVAWARHSEDPEQASSAYRMRRLTSAGLAAPGFAPEGIDLAEFHGEYLDDASPVTGLCAISEDGSGGVFAQLGLLEDIDWTAMVQSRIYRLQGDGTTAAGWPAGGMLTNNTWYADVGPDGSHFLMANGQGGALVGNGQNYLHGVGGYSVAATEPDGTPLSSAGTGYNGKEVVPNGRGGAYVASFWPDGPYGMYDPNAYIGVAQVLAPAGWTNFSEVQTELVNTWYGDVGLAETGDGGAFFFWSQEREKFGLFARRFNGAGQVTAVPPGAEVAALSLGRLKFVAGEGVRASFAIPAGREASLDVFDVGGRRVASSRIAAGTREAVVPGTSRLPSGLYFARLATANQAASGKVLVAR